MTNSRDWVRLADYVINRRAELGYGGQEALADAAGFSVKTVTRIEGGTAVSSSTLGKLERGLRWMPGSVRAVLAGGLPTEQPEPEAEPIDPVKARLLREEFADLRRKYGAKRALRLIDEVVAELREIEAREALDGRPDEYGTG
ncbi:MAG TPA: hypothetical protein VHX38_28880 [Pseudonocardiaceae bacterium]|jgi:transcriptional regulator with XRE-family HTH domain|nr:hypothetical protein [Pseudonocardiaceae bacterium]